MSLLFSVLGGGATYVLRRALVVLTGTALVLTTMALAPWPAAQAAPPPETVALRINFGPSTGTASGFTQDTGAAWTDAAGRGWVREDSLGGTRVPLDLSINTRNRGAGTSPCSTGAAQTRTFIHMDNPAAASATNNPTPGAWEQTVPNGQYRVEVGYGDANLGVDPESHTLNVEGVTLVRNDVASPAPNCTVSRMRKATGWVTVTDGRLTVDSVGGTNTKLAWITVDSVPVAGLTAAVEGPTSISLDWADVDGAVGYKVWRTESLPAPGGNDAVPVALLGSPTASAFTDTTAEKGVLYQYSVGTAATASAVNGTVVTAMSDDATPTRPTLPLKVDFRDRVGVTAPDYVADFGRGYSNARGYGWVAPGTQTPLSLVGNGRTRPVDATLPAALNTMIHAQYPATGYNQVNGVQRAGAWQVAVADGAYDVTLTVGDGSPGTDATRNVVNLEGVNAVDYTSVTGAGAAQTGAARFKTVTVPGVQVTDGFLTVDALGGTNTKLTDLTVSPAAPVDEKPAAPTGLTAAAGDSQVTLDWTDNTEPDLAGYEVFRATSTPVPTTGTPLNGSTPLTDSRFVDTTAQNTTTYHYVVLAVDDAGQRSVASPAVSATPDAAQPRSIPVPFGVNFVDAATEVPAGFEKDFGQAYANARGYGWVTPTTGAPLSLVGNGRLRAERAGVTVGLRQRGLVHMQADDITGSFTGVKAEGAWEVAIADGTYEVTVSVGDQPGASNVYDSVHSLDVEGVSAISRFQGTAADEFETATVEVEVTDGRLTIDGADGSNTKINYVDVALADTAAPDAPTGLTATAGDARVDLVWDANDDADLAGYRVYASTNADVALTDANRISPSQPQSATGFAHTGLTNDTAYHYVVTAVDESGNESVASSTATATPADRVAPASPSSLQATAGDGFVELAWTASTSSDVERYRVFRGTTADVATTGSPLATIDHPTTTHTDLTAQNGTEYFYVVVAVDRAGNASDATAAEAATPADEVAPNAPVGVNTLVGDRSVKLSWSGGQATDTTSYRVYRATTAGVTVDEENLLGEREAEDGTTYDDITVVNGTTYYYRITAVDEAGNESEASAEVSATPVPDPDLTPPAVPGGVTATGDDDRVTVAWTAVTGSDDLRGYRVYRAAAPGVTGTLVSGETPLLGGPYVDLTARNGNAYTYTVTSVDTTGNESARSAEATATPADRTAPNAPTGVVATAGVNRVTLTWDAAQTGSDVAKYRIYRSTSAAAYPEGYDQFGAFTATQPRTFIDANVDPGTTYRYVVTAVDDAVPANESVASTVTNATPLPTPDTTAPNAPTELRATVAGSDVELRWTASTSNDTAGYEVYRADVAGGAPVKISSGVVTGTTFTDVGRPAGSAGHYTVVALDTASNASAPSNTATASIPSAAVELAYVFQPDSAPVPSGFVKDTGAAFTAAAGRGFVTQASLSSQTHVPLDLSGNTRLRTRTTVTAEQNRLVHLQYGDIVPTPTTNGDLTPGAWEHVLPNGRYTVTASVGDQPGAAKTGCAAPCYDSKHTVRAEGVALVSAFQATAATEYATGTATVDVTDGRLTLDAIGGTNTKLNWVRIVGAGPLAPDTTPPGAATGLVATPGDRAASLSWTAPADTDVAGYDVFRAEGDTVVPGPATKVSTSLVLGTSFADTGLTNGTRYAYAVRATDTSGNTGPVSAVTTVTPAATAADVSVKVDFADAATVPPTGYLLDYGQSFGARTGANQGTGLTYGWVSPDTTTPVSLVGNGRNRNVLTPVANEPDARRASFIHMQYAGTAAGSVAVNGSWEIAVPNGLYTVKVDVGDAGTAIDSTNWVNIENQNAVAAFTPTSATKYATATRVVSVTDGRITLSPVGGTNTKITYVDIATFRQEGRPFSTVVLPSNGATGVVTNVSPTASNELPGGAVDPATVVSGVRLTRVSDGVAVPGVGATSGGGDTVSFRPAEGVTLLPETLYRFEILDTATDVSGKRFVPFSSVFTTRTDTTNPGGTAAAFDKLPSGASQGGAYTSLAFGPDGRLYAGTIYGQIYRWTVRADGTLTDQTIINTVRTHASNAGWEGAPNRTVIGLAFDPASTAENPVLWITDNYAYLGTEVPNGTGAISRLSGANLQNYQEVVVNLPRSIKDHETNSLAFHDGKIYVTQGSMNAMGATDGTWKKPENLLSASVLELDPAKLPANLPVDVSTPDMVKGGTNPRQHAGTYDPYAPGAPLTMYATGIRNAYDLVWHSNGNLYTGTNGSAAGGNTPATPTTLPASCAKRPDGGYTGPTAPALTNNRQDETDYIFNVKKGKYYGHPNPLRCEFILNAGNPTGYTGNPLFKVNAYPAGQQADPNYDLRNVYDAGMHASANGTIEYQNAGAFGGSLKGKLIVVRYSANQELVTFDVRADGSLSTATTGITGFTGFAQPLDVVEDPATGNLYVSELTNNFANTAIRLLKPQGGGSNVGRPEATPRLVFTEVVGGAASPTQNVVVRNVGSGPLTVTGATVSGTDAALFTRTGTFPLTVPAGGSVNFPVSFNPTVAGPRGAVLTLTTDSTVLPTVTTTLRGLGTLGQGGTNEPSLQWILDTLQIPVNVGDPDPTNNAMPSGSALIGDEVQVQSFRRDPFDNIVKFEPLALFGPNGPNGDTVTVGVHDSDDPSDRTVVGVGPNGQNQRLLPAFTGTGSTDLPDTFGLDFTWHGLSNRVTYSEDALNTWGGTDPHKVRVYPLKNADGSVEPYAYVVAPEDVPTGVDFQDAVMIVRNVQPVVTAGQGQATADRSELVYSGVRGTTSAEQPVTVTNTGTTPLEISSVVVTGTHASDFALGTDGGPRVLPVGGTATYRVAFKPGASVVGVRSAALRVTSDDADAPTLDVGLYGLSLNGLEGGNEPPLADVVRTLGRSINVGWSGLTNDSPATGTQLEGDEVVAPLFTRAGTGPVTLKPVARFSPDEQLPFGWYLPTPGTPERHEVARIAAGQYQTLNPAIAAGGSGSFDPAASSFGIYVDSLSFGRSSYTQDALNTGVPHAVRTYPAKDRAGTVIPNTYLVTFEDASNGDYQDYVFELSNVRIAGATGGSTPVARIDFGPAASAVASGYTRDSGAAFVTGGSGWVNQETGAPQAMTALTRDRAGVNLNQSTLLLMQPTATQQPAGPARWRYTVPNGTYTVTVGVGDPDFADSVHRINVEGQTVVPAFTPDADTRSTTGTASVTVTDGVLDVDAVGGTNTKIQYLDVDRPLNGTDTTPPAVSAIVSGLQQSPGVYRDEATVTVAAADPESSVAITSLSLDGGPFTTYTAPVKVTTAGEHTVRARAQNGAGAFTVTAPQTFRVVAGGAPRGDVVVANADGVPFPDRLVMNRIQTPDADVPNVVHDVGTLRVSNTGTGGLNVTGLDVTGPFTLVDAPALPRLVPAGGSLDVQVRFTATTAGSAAGLWNGSLTLRTDDADEPTVPVELAGFWQSVSENGQEPDLIEITRLFGYGTQIVSPGQPLNQQGLLKPNGDEVISPYWVRANAAAPVTVRQLAAFHTQGNTASFFWHAKGSTSTGTVLTHVGVDGQSILPRKNDSGRTPGVGTFSPTGTFGFKIDPEWSDPTRNDSGIDRTNGCPATAQCGHHLRIWPARDRSGAVIAHTYLVSMDYAGINYDYNDNVYLVSNIRPEIAEDPSATAPVPGAGSLELGFGSAVDGTLVDGEGVGTGFRSTQPNERDVTPGSDSYVAGLLDVDTSGPGTLKVTSSGTNGTTPEGTNGGNDNTLVNGLRLPFDGTGAPFSVSAKVLGPITQLDSGSEQVGVQLGNDQDNFVKVAVIQKTVGGTTGPAIEFLHEQNGTGTTVGTPVLVPAPGAVTSIDLALLADPGTRVVRAAYRTNGGTWTVLPTSFTAPAAFAGKLFDVRSQAGILVSHKGGTPFVAQYDAFAVTAGDVTGGSQPAREALLRIDTGSSTSYTDGAGRVWTPDTGLFTPTSAPNEGNRGDAIAGTTDDPLYATYRGNTGSVTPRTLTYALPTKAATTVDLRLHFAERSAGNAAAGRRLFDIDVEGRTVRSGFDIFAAAGGLNTATIVDVNNVTVRGGVLDLALRATADYPAISAIEVLCKGACPVDTTAPAAPSGLAAAAAPSGVTLTWNEATEVDVVGYRVYRAASADGPFTELTSSPVGAATYVDTTAPANVAAFYRVVAVDSSGNVSTPSSVVSATRPQPVQQPVRINTGGPAQTVGGTTWTACSSLTACSSWVTGGGPYSEADTVTGLPAGTNNTIFQTEWTGGATGSNPTPVGQRAFGFAVPVLNGQYTVRLHFVELNKTAAGTRTFDVRLEGTTVLSDFDIWSQAGGIDRAIVRQFPATVTDGVMTIDFIRRIENAKISAIEILPGADTTAPGAPGSLTANGTATGIGLSWPAVNGDDVAGYRVVRSASADGPFTPVGTGLVTGTTYSDTTAPAGERSYYQVRTVDTAGNASAPVAASAVRPVAAPGQVTGVGATGSAAGITVTWTASTAAGLTGYNVYRSATATGTFTKLNNAPVSGTSYADASAPAGATSYYQVTAVNPTGESPRSATVNAARPAAVPGQVTGVGATGSQTGIAVSWTASTATSLTGYNVYRSATADGTFTKLNASPVSGTGYADASAAAGATSYYQVTAVNAAGESPRSATASALRPAAPANPSTVRINAGGPSVTVSGTTWSACSAVGACDGRVSGGFPYSENDTITGVPAGMSNAIFQSEWTGGATGTGQVPVGSRAFGFAVPVANGAYQVRLHFAELNKTGAGQRTFDVRLENATVLSSFDIWSAAGGIDRAISRQFPVTVTDGVMTIDFVRRIENAKVSAIEIVPADTTAPAAVTGVSASGATAGNTVRWTASTASDLAGYHVYRSSSATGAFTRVTTTAVTGTSYVDASAPAGATSYYQVTAIDRDGNESVRSATVSAARPAAPRPTIRINTGGPSVTVSGTTWSACSAVAACEGRVSGGYPYSENDTITGVPAGMSNAIFQSEWTGGALGTGQVPVGSRAFGFAVPVTNGAYQVRLWFAELNKNGAGLRTFDVRLENATVLSDFDIWAQAGGIDRAISRQFPVSVTDGVMTIDFVRRIENAKVSAIEIIPVDAAVSRVTASGASTGNTLRWQGASEDDLAGYDVYRGESPSSPARTFTKVNTAPVSGSSYTDTTAPAGSTSYYQVNAVDLDGAVVARSVVVSATRPARRPTIRINAGGPRLTVAGATWSACTGKGTDCTRRVVGGVRATGRDVVRGVPAGLSRALFQSEWTGGVTKGNRVGRGQRAFGFRVPVSDGRYRVRLHFAERTKTQAGQRVFDVRLENRTVLPAFDVLAEAGGADRAVSRDFDVRVGDGMLSIDFIRRVSDATVSAIEVVPID